MKIAVTGGTGFVGRHLIALLRRRGHTVVPVSRRTGHDLADAALDVDRLAAALAGCTAVVHCAGINRELGRQTYARVHVRGTRLVVEAARRAGVSRIVVQSFLRARPECGSAYHESKWAAEELVRESGLDYTVVKAGVVAGPGDHLIEHLSRAVSTFPFFPLLGRHDVPVKPVVVEDLAEVLAAAIDDPRLSRRTVMVTGPEELPLREVVARVAAVARGDRRRLWFARLPVAIHYALAFVFERLMRVPLVSIAQVRILSEGLTTPAPFAEALPPDLVPRRRLTAERIRAGLPERRRFGPADLRCCRARTVRPALQ